MMKLYNTRTRQIERFEPLDTSNVRIYSCGPTVYDYIHIGNLSAFIYADTLRRVLQTSGYTITHLMNFTDVDDKTISRSIAAYPDLDPNRALKELTRHYSKQFLKDISAIGNDVDAYEFIYATDYVEAMRQLIRELYDDGFAYLADDGVYFSIQKYRDTGKIYGQLSHITVSSTAGSRVQNDEYDKESAHDFALWKSKKSSEPYWEFEIDSQNFAGRPGWHIECSAMSVARLGMPFDIHTGGVDLIFPHHENEIAQSTAGAGNTYAQYFFHNEHLMVDGKKMSKSLQNFYTLRDIQAKGYDPLAFRLMILQSHYRSQSNFTWENLTAAQNRLSVLKEIADLKWQCNEAYVKQKSLATSMYSLKDVTKYLQSDLNTSQALSIMQAQLEILRDKVYAHGGLPLSDLQHFQSMLQTVDDLFGLGLSTRADIADNEKLLLKERETARSNKNWDQSDVLRQALKLQGITVRDTDSGAYWSKD